MKGQLLAGREALLLSHAPSRAHSPSRPSLGFRAVSLLWAGSTNETGIELLPLGLAGTSLPHWGGQSAHQSWPKGQEPRAVRRAGKGPSPACQAVGCYLFLSGLVETLL